MKTRNLAHLIILCMLAVSACDSNDPDSGDNDDDGDEVTGSATVTVSGPIDAEYEGTATFASVAGISHAITIALDDDKGNLTISAFGSADEGTYPFGDESSQGIWGGVANFADLGTPADPSGFLALTEGSITITRSDEDRIDGRFNATANDFSDVRVNVSGQFVARCFAALGLCRIGG